MSASLAASLLQEVTQNLPRMTGNLPGATKVVPDGHVFEATAHTPPPPFRGALPSPQSVASPSLAPDTPLAATVHRLLDDTDAAIARQTLLQVASLPDRVDASGHRIDPTVPQWNFEIPFATPQGTAMAQFEISRDGGNEFADPAKRAWRARFSLNVEPAGPVHALISLNGDRTFVRMWAERPPTAQQLRAGVSELSQAMSQSRTQARRHRDPRRHAAATGTGPAPDTSWIARYERRTPSSQSRCITKRQRRTCVVAKGRGTIGAKIVEVAKAHDIPIEENEVLAGALSKSNSARKSRPISTRRSPKCWCSCCGCRVVQGSA